MEGYHGDREEEEEGGEVDGVYGDVGGKVGDDEGEVGGWEWV